MYFLVKMMYTVFVLSEFRSEVLETMRQAAIKFPSLTFTFGSQWLQTTLETPIDLGVGKSSFKHDFWEHGGLLVECQTLK